MSNLTFITGNPNKANLISKALGTRIDHHELDLDEIQSLDLKTIVDHKAKQAYQILKTPVLVEDISLEFHAFKRLPGPFVKWYLKEVGNQGLCDILKDKDRSATAKVCYGLYDGRELLFFEGEIEGEIAMHPAGSNSFGWDAIFINKDQAQTRAELDPEIAQKISMRYKPLQDIARHIQALAR